MKHSKKTSLLALIIILFIKTAYSLNASNSINNFNVFENSDVIFLKSEKTETFNSNSNWTQKKSILIEEAFTRNINPISNKKNENCEVDSYKRVVAYTIQSDLQ